MPCWDKLRRATGAGRGTIPSCEMTPENMFCLRYYQEGADQETVLSMPICVHHLIQLGIPNQTLDTDNRRTYGTVDKFIYDFERTSEARLVQELELRTFLQWFGWEWNGETFHSPLNRALVDPFTQLRGDLVVFEEDLSMGMLPADIDAGRYLDELNRFRSMGPPSPVGSATTPTPSTYTPPRQMSAPPNTPDGRSRLERWLEDVTAGQEPN
ncbi:hypothetical protein MMC25_005990 [Agyrium rufum]|nr:hypothetical protein [Agyrium rufum]